MRVLVDQGSVDEFDVGADALNAKWDGKNDRDEDLPAGKYHARGYMVGALKAEDLGPATTPVPLDLNNRAQVKLVSNPLSKDAKTIVDLVASFEDDQIVLKSADGLPLFTVIEAAGVTRLFAKKSGEKSIDLWADNGNLVEQIRVSNVDQMMAFDCGEIELK